MTGFGEAAQAAMKRSRMRVTTSPETPTNVTGPIRGRLRVIATGGCAAPLAAGFDGQVTTFRAPAIGPVVYEALIPSATWITSVARTLPSASSTWYPAAP